MRCNSQICGVLIQLLTLKLLKIQFPSLDYYIQCFEMNKRKILENFKKIS